VRKEGKMKKVILLVVFGLLTAVNYTRLALAQSKCCTEVYSGEPVARAWGANFVGQLGDGITTQ
jgi:hypothetical protein